MSIGQHPCLTEPECDQVLWKYMDFTKLISILETKSLYFANISRFKDRYEGQVRPKSYRLTESLIRSAGLEGDKAFLQFIKETTDEFRRGTYANCWTKNDGESAAMWRTYLTNPDEGVAIKTTYKRIKDSLATVEKRVFAAIVTYGHEPLESRILLEVDFILHAVHKRKCFESEKEVRLLACKQADDSCGLAIAVDTNLLIDQVVTSPTSNAWFTELVQSVTKKYGLNRKIIRSDVFDGPSDSSAVRHIES